jgi:DNA-binding response OmpR family regulator
MRSRAQGLRDNVRSIIRGDEDGRDLLRQLRLMSDIPVGLLTGRGHDIDKIAGLKMGADDHIVKPPLPRRALGPDRIITAPNPQVDTGIGHRRLRRAGHQLRPQTSEVHGKVVDLTPKEFDMLAFLAASPRRADSRAQLLEHLSFSSTEWQRQATVTEHIRRLRRKTEPTPGSHTWITTVRGVGYRFEPPTQAVQDHQGNDITATIYDCSTEH